MLTTLKNYADFLIVFGVLAVVTAYTLWTRHDAVTVDRAEATIASDKQIFQIQERKNEIHNRPMSDERSIKRLRAGTF